MIPYLIIKNPVGRRRLHGHVVIQGLDISIENAKSSSRQWHNPHDGSSGITHMKHAYGYVKGTLGADGDAVDVYIGPHRESQKVFVVHQMKAPTFSDYDEDKILIGFLSATKAKKAYLNQYSNPKFFGGMVEMTMDQFKEKLETHKGQMIKSRVKEHLRHEPSGKVSIVHEYQDKRVKHEPVEPLSDSMMSTKWIPTFYLDRLRQMVIDSAKKARKLGVPPIGIKITDEQKIIATPIPEYGDFGFTGKYHDRKIPHTKVMLFGEAPRLNGWKLVGNIQHDTASKKNVVVGIGGFEIPKKYRSADSFCEHCKTHRRRNDTYLVQKGKVLKQVGKDCLKDFTGSNKDAEQIAAAVQFVNAMVNRDYLDDEDYRGERQKYQQRDRFMKYVVDTAKKYGWLSATAARERGGTSTASEAWSRMHSRDGQDHTFEKTTDSETKKLLAWVKKEFPKLKANTEYMANLKAAMSADGYFHERHFGLVGSLYGLYKRAAETAEPKQKVIPSSPAEDVKVGERKGWELTYKGNRPMDGFYGTTYITKFVDDHGRKFTWFASNEPEMTEGKRYNITATVKDIRMYNGQPDHQLTRAVIQGTATTGSSMEANPKAEKFGKQIAKIVSKGATGPQVLAEVYRHLQKTTKATNFSRIDELKKYRAVHALEHVLSLGEGSRNKTVAAFVSAFRKMTAEQVGQTIYHAMQEAEVKKNPVIEVVPEVNEWNKKAGLNFMVKVKGMPAEQYVSGISSGRFKTKEEAEAQVKEYNASGDVHYPDDVDLAERLLPKIKGPIKKALPFYPMLKSHIHAYTRTTTSGRTVMVSGHDDKRRTYIPESNGHQPVKAPNGRDNFGAIQGEVAMKTGLPPGPIKLLEGKQFADHHGFGKQHIAAQHGEEIRAAGFKSEEEFVADVVKNYSAIYDAGGGRYALVSDGARQKIHIVEIERKNGEAFYNIITAYISNRPKFTERNHKLIWKRGGLRKSHIRAYARALVSGKTIMVREHNDKRAKKDVADTAPLRRGESRALAKKVVADLLGGIPKGVNVFAFAPTYKLTTKGTVSLVGQKIQKAEDLASLAQIYRNPSVETLHYIFVKKDKVVGHSAVSSRLPGLSLAFPGEASDPDLGAKGTAWVEQQLKSCGADGYWMLHNHPSGIVQMSAPDLKITKLLDATVAGLKGHIVINHNKYSVLYPDESRENEHSFSPASTEKSIEGISHTLLGATITSAGSLIKSVKMLPGRDKKVVIVFQKGLTGVNCITEMSLDAGPEKIAATAKEYAIKLGSSLVLAALPGEAGLLPWHQSVREGVFTDVVNETLESVRGRGVEPKANYVLGGVLRGDVTISDKTNKLKKPLKKGAEEHCKKIGDDLGVDWKKVDLDEFCDGMYDESEHKHVIDKDDIPDSKQLAQIVLDHLKEDKHYYKKLKAAGLSKARFPMLRVNIEPCPWLERP